MPSRCIVINGFPCDLCSHPACLRILRDVLLRLDSPNSQYPHPGRCGAPPSTLWGAGGDIWARPQLRADLPRVQWPPDFKGEGDRSGSAMTAEWLKYDVQTMHQHLMTSVSGDLMPTGEENGSVHHDGVQWGEFGSGPDSCCSWNWREGPPRLQKPGELFTNAVGISVWTWTCCYIRPYPAYVQKH